MDEYTIKDLRILGISREKAQDWIGRGFIKPSIEQASGKGTMNIFSRWDLYGIALFIYFLKRGVSRDYAGDYVDSWTVCTKNKLISDRKKIRYAIIRFVPVDLNRKPESSFVDLRPSMAFDPEILILDSLDDFDINSFIQKDKYRDDLMIINIKKIIDYVDDKLV